MVIWSLWQLLFEAWRWLVLGREGKDIKAFIWDPSLHNDRYFALLLLGYDSRLENNGWN